jgi:hypothetical protein
MKYFLYICKLLFKKYFDNSYGLLFFFTLQQV